MDVKTVQAHALTIAVAVVGQLIAFVPALASEKQALISGGAFVVGAAILIAHAIRSKQVQAPVAPSSLTAVAQDARTLVELAQVLAPLAEAKALPQPPVAPPPPAA